MDSKTIRYKNTRLLVEQIGGVSNFSEKINKGQSQTSQFAGTNPIKGIGNKVAREIEKAFGKPHGWLDQLQKEVEEQIPKENAIDKLSITGGLIPIISWVQASTWNSKDFINLETQFKEWLPPNPKSGKNGYGLIVVGESMSPEFRPGDKIYVNPDFQINNLKTGDLVIIASKGENKATFKKIIIESNGIYLEPLNPKWHERITKLPNGSKLVGKVVGLYRDV